MNKNICSICQECFPTVEIDRIEEGMTGREVANLLYNNFDKLNKSKADICTKHELDKMLRDQYHIYNDVARQKFIDEVFYTFAKQDVKGSLSDFKKLKDIIHDHLVDYTNPHRVTKDQVGLDQVDNTSDKDKPISDAVAKAIDELYEAIDNVDEREISYTINGYKINTNPILDGNDIELDNYTKVSVDTAIDSDDTVTKAIGKLEYRLEEGVKDSVDALEQEIAARIAADEALSNDITEETHNRIDEDNKLQQNITDLDNKYKGVTDGIKDNLQQHITEANAALSAEQQARQEADTELQNNIDTESSARQEADKQLQQNIDNLNASLTEDIEDVSNDLSTHINDKNNPHEVTKEQVGLGNVTNDVQVKRSEMGVANGVATLNESGQIPSTQLPSYVDDVLEYDTFDSLPETGESGKIYVTLDTDLTYRWSGTQYVEVSKSLALGETSSTAFPGDRGKTVEDRFNSLPSNIISGWSDAPVTANTDSVTLQIGGESIASGNYDTNFSDDVILPSATTTTAGVMSASDKTKLDSLASKEDLMIPADEEDITSESGSLKFKDREYDEANFSGKGYKILRKNIQESKNILTQDMINEANTIYEIRYDFDLNSATITIPEGCTLKFEGGSLSNGILNGDIYVIGQVKLYNCHTNYLVNADIYLSWFIKNKDNESYSDYIDSLFENYNSIKVPTTYHLDVANIPISRCIYLNKKANQISCNIVHEVDKDRIYGITTSEDFSDENILNISSQNGSVFIDKLTIYDYSNGSGQCIYLSEIFRSTFNNIRCYSTNKTALYLKDISYDTFNDCFIQSKNDIGVNLSYEGNTISFNNCHINGNTAVYVPTSTDSGSILGYTSVYFNNTTFENNNTHINIGNGVLYFHECYIGDNSKYPIIIHGGTTFIDGNGTNIDGCSQANFESITEYRSIITIDGGTLYLNNVRFNTLMHNSQARINADIINATGDCNVFINNVRLTNVRYIGNYINSDDLSTIHLNNRIKNYIFNGDFKYHIDYSMFYQKMPNYCRSVYSYEPFKTYNNTLVINKNTDELSGRHGIYIPIYIPDDKLNTKLLCRIKWASLQDITEDYHAIDVFVLDSTLQLNSTKYAISPNVTNYPGVRSRGLIQGYQNGQQYTYIKDKVITGNYVFELENNYSYLVIQDLTIDHWIPLRICSIEIVDYNNNYNLIFDSYTQDDIFKIKLSDISSSKNAVFVDNATDIQILDVDSNSIHYTYNNKILPNKGTTQDRPDLNEYNNIFKYFDTTLNKPIWWNGTEWIQAGITDLATTTEDGLMSSEDKTKLNTIINTGDGTKYLADDGTYKTIDLTSLDDKYVSVNNIKTINGESIIGTGDITISAESGIEDAPSDGKQYVRQNGAWVEVSFDTTELLNRIQALEQALTLKNI